MCLYILLQEFECNFLNSWDQKAPLPLQIPLIILIFVFKSHHFDGHMHTYLAVENDVKLVAILSENHRLPTFLNHLDAKVPSDEFVVEFRKLLVIFEKLYLLDYLDEFLNFLFGDFAAGDHDEDLHALHVKFGAF